MRQYLLLLISFFLIAELYANPPKPPVGKRWVLNSDFSDEFNGTKLDESKWLDHHPSWIGREPGLFMPSQVSVKDGYLQIRGEKMDKDTIIHAYNRELKFNIKGGAVVSKKSAYLGYYESRLKASETTMSATFWFSSGSSKGPNDCDKYSLEWDIQECIGRNGDFEGSYFANGMHSNSHYWYSDCEKGRHDYRAPQVKYEDKNLASADFHVYGGWWHDETLASYYYDNGAPKFQHFYNEVSKTPFDKPMHMRLVVETYPFPWIELPSDEELADSSRNVVLYDWVRGYSLVDADDAQIDDSGKMKLETELELYQEGVSFQEASMEITSSKSLRIPLVYQTNQDREIRVRLLAPDDTKVTETTIKAYAGYANLFVDLKLDKKLAAAEGYSIVTDVFPIVEGKRPKPLDVSRLKIDIVKRSFWGKK